MMIVNRAGRGLGRLAALGMPALAAAMLFGAVASAAPRQIVYTGYLTTDAGGIYSPVAGSIEVSVTLYDDPTGSANYWGPHTQSGVTVSHGIFSVVLDGATSSGNLAGGPVTLDQFLYAADSVWLEFSIDGTAMSPRQRVVSVPYAVVAWDAERLGGVLAEDFVTVDASGALQAPAGPVKIAGSEATCDGSLEGALRYNTTEKTLELCNGTEWGGLTSSGGSSGGSGTDLGNDGDTYSGGQVVADGFGVEYAAPGSYSFVVPADVTLVQATVIGGGGGGGAGGGGTAGGGGGGYALGQYAVTPGSSISVVVGEGGTVPDPPAQPYQYSDGGASSFGSFAIANGGQGAFNQSSRKNGGTASGGTLLNLTGGYGGASSEPGGDGPTGGGGGYTSPGNRYDGGNATQPHGGAGGDGQIDQSGSHAQKVISNGQSYGGGGGGGGGWNSSGIYGDYCNGAGGYVRIEWGSAL